jgi:hypothetical protein
MLDPGANASGQGRSITHESDAAGPGPLPSHVAERTNRFARLMPLIMVGSKRIDINISPELTGYLAL